MARGEFKAAEYSDWLFVDQSPAALFSQVNCSCVIPYGLSLKSKPRELSGVDVTASASTVSVISIPSIASVLYQVHSELASNVPVSKLPLTYTFRDASGFSDTSKSSPSYSASGSTLLKVTVEGRSSTNQVHNSCVLITDDVEVVVSAEASGIATRLDPEKKKAATTPTILFFRYIFSPILERC